MSKSSSDILNELFSKFNATFDDPHGESSSSSSSSSSSDSDTKSKKKKKKKDKKTKVRDKSKKRDKDKEKLKRAQLKLEKEKKLKAKAKKLKLESQKKKKKVDNEKEDTKTFKPTTIVLDLEEGEIIDEEEKAKRKSAKQKSKISKRILDSPSLSYNLGHEDGVGIDRTKRKKSKSKQKDIYPDELIDDHGHKKKSHHHHDEVIESSDYRHSSSRKETYDRTSTGGSRSPSRESGHRRKSTNSAGSSSSRHHHSSSHEKDRHGSDSPIVTRRAPPREDDDDRYHKTSYSSSSSSYKTNWQKASSRDTSYVSEKIYLYDDRRRDSRDYYYDHDSRDKYYSGGRSGFGYSGSRKFYDNEDEDNYYDYRRRSSRYESSSSSYRRGRSRSRSRSPRHPDDIIDKAKLLEIARHNASKLMRKGVLPSDIFSRDQIMAIRAGGKSVEELTEYCKKLAEKDARGDLRDDASSDSDDEHFINHPFMVKDRPLPSIVMNIRNAIPLPARSAHELALENAKLKIQFPVSSGTRHRYKELEWKPVEDDEKDKTTKDESKSLVPVDGPKVGTVAPMPQATADDSESKPVEDIPLPSKPSYGPLAITAGPGSETGTDDKKGDEGESKKTSKTSSETINKIPTVTVDISSLISMRLRAMRQLQEDPDDKEAQEAMELATQEMKNWAEAKALEPKFLTQAEINAGPQAWVRKDQLKNTVELKSGMGLHLLQKMGWKPGEGLGKNKEGSTVPLALDIKMDKKGLTSSADLPGGGPSMPNIFDLSAKHPVSALMELCLKRKWGQPTFDLCFEHGSAHKKQFVYKVTVNGVEYQPCIASNTKKLAKANSAAFCLQSLGLLPTTKASTNQKRSSETVPNSKPNLLQTVPTSKPNFLQTVPTPPSEFKIPAIPEPRPVPKPDVSQASQSAAPASTPPQSSGALPTPSQPVGPRPTSSQSFGSRPTSSQSFGPRPTSSQSLGSRPTSAQSFGSRPAPHLNFAGPQIPKTQLPVRSSKYEAPSQEFRVSRDPAPTFNPTGNSGPQMFNRMPNMQSNNPMQRPQPLMSVSPYASQSQLLRPAQPPIPSYQNVPQTQVAAPQSSGFPGLITF